MWSVCTYVFMCATIRFIANSGIYEIPVTIEIIDVFEIEKVIIKKHWCGQCVLTYQNVLL